MASAETEALDGPSDAQLTTIVLRTLAAVVALLLAGGVASAAGRMGEGPDETAADTVVGLGGLSPRGAIGPLPGTSVASYVRSRGADLAAVTGSRRAAVVSFTSYRTREDVLPSLGGVEVTALLVALPGGRPVEARVDEDLGALAKRQRDEATAEKKALEELLPTVQDPDFKRQYEADIDRLAALLAGPARPPAIVYGAVVVGRGDALRAIAARAGVRLVDVALDAEVPGPGEAAGLRPEETAKAGEPPTRPI